MASIKLCSYEIMGAHIEWVTIHFFSALTSLILLPLRSLQACLLLLLLICVPIALIRDPNPGVCVCFVCVELN